MLVKEILHPISVHFKLLIQNRKWRKKNKHNTITFLSLCDTNNISVGKKSYGKIDVHTFGNPDEGLTIGNYCSITNGCSFIMSGEHNYKRLSTYPVGDVYSDAQCKGKIIIEDDVWIGYNCVILSGVRIGQGAVIGAGSVIAKDVPPYAIVVGSPAKIVKYRFDESTISKLLELDYSSFNLEKVDKKMLSQNIDKLSLQELYKYLNWREKNENK